MNLLMAADSKLKGPLASRTILQLVNLIKSKMNIETLFQNVPGWTPPIPPKCFLKLENQPQSGKLFVITIFLYFYAHLLVGKSYFALCINFLDIYLQNAAFLAVAGQKEDEQMDPPVSASAHPLFKPSFVKPCP